MPWITEPRQRPHYCELPHGDLIEANLGREWQCSECGKVWVVDYPIAFGTDEDLAFRPL
jgi:hypothetical protein